MRNTTSRIGQDFIAKGNATAKRQIAAAKAGPKGATNGRMPMTSGSSVAQPTPTVSGALPYSGPHPSGPAPGGTGFTGKTVSIQHGLTPNPVQSGMA